MTSTNYTHAAVLYDIARAVDDLVGGMRGTAWEHARARAIMDALYSIADGEQVEGFLEHTAFKEVWESWPPRRR